MAQLENDMAGEQGMMAQGMPPEGMAPEMEQGEGEHDTVTCPNCGAKLIIELAAESAMEHEMVPEDLRAQIGAAMGPQGA
jgi:hypothetical protein